MASTRPSSRSVDPLPEKKNKISESYHTTDVTSRKEVERTVGTD